MNGVINVLKPSGITSSDMVVRVKGLMRKLYGVKEKVGHFGTLDPNATGVLVIALGNCNKLFDFQLTKKKKYRAGFCFGFSTDTCDSYGEVLAEDKSNIPSFEQISSALLSLRGKRLQVPPVYSAKKVNGVPSYSLARKNAGVELNAKEIEVFEIDNLTLLSDRSFMADITCSSGTYIRSIASELSEILNCPCYMDRLIRVECCGLSLQNSHTFDELEKNFSDNVISCETFLSDYQTLSLDKKFLFKFVNGQQVKIEGYDDGIYLLSIGGIIFGLVELTHGNVKVLARLYENS